jgi:hypothetical protein
METITGPELVEALTPFQPKNLDEATWARFRDDAVVLVAKLELPNSYQGVWHLSVLAHMLAEVAPLRPGASLADLLDLAEIEGYLTRCRDAGMPARSLEKRQGGLNRLLRAHTGQPSAARRREAEPRLTPHLREQVAAVTAAALRSTDAGAMAFLRVLAAVTAGQPLPGRSAPHLRVPVTLDGQRATLGTGEDARVWRAGRLLPAAMAGDLLATSVSEARRWVRQTAGWDLDVRRLQLTVLTAEIGVLPAVEVLRRAGIGRDRLSAAVAAARRPEPAAITALLRGVREPHAPA